MQYYWLKGSKYYKLLFQKNLFGDTDIICIWGRLGTKRGRYKSVLCQNQQDLHSLINKIAKRRIARGYQLAS